MSGLANLARLLGQATPRRLDGPYYGSAMDMDANASLIAAAPQMAELLLACAGTLAMMRDQEPCGDCNPDPSLSDGLLSDFRFACVACHLLARLADFDRRLT